jgi:hypothetical protein
MPSLKNGKSTSRKPSVSVENITQWGIWIHVMGREYYLDYKHFPWFRDATLRQIHDVQLVRRSYLRWPTLNVDLELDCLTDPQRYPLQYR